MSDTTTGAENYTGVPPTSDAASSGGDTGSLQDFFDTYSSVDSDVTSDDDNSGIGTQDDEPPAAGKEGDAETDPEDADPLEDDEEEEDADDGKEPLIPRERFNAVNTRYQEIKKRYGPALKLIDSLGGPEALASEMQKQEQAAQENQMATLKDQVTAAVDTLIDNAQLDESLRDEQIEIHLRAAQARIREDQLRQRESSHVIEVGMQKMRTEFPLLDEEEALAAARRGENVYTVAKRSHDKMMGVFARFGITDSQQALAAMKGKKPIAAAPAAPAAAQRQTQQRIPTDRQGRPAPVPQRGRGGSSAAPGSGYSDMAPADINSKEFEQWERDALNGNLPSQRGN